MLHMVSQLVPCSLPLLVELAQRVYSNSLIEYWHGVSDDMGDVNQLNHRY